MLPLTRRDSAWVKNLMRLTFAANGNKGTYSRCPNYDSISSSIFVSVASPSSSATESSSTSSSQPPPGSVPKGALVGGAVGAAVALLSVGIIGFCIGKRYHARRLVGSSRLQLAGGTRSYPPPSIMTFSPIHPTASTIQSKRISVSGPPCHCLFTSHSRAYRPR